MDDDMEDEIICELFSVHIHLLWKYLRMTSSGIADLILPGPGESFRNKMLQPGPFMVITLLLIVSSLVLQSRHHWIQKMILSCHQSLSFNFVADHSSLKNFVSASMGNEINISQEYVEDIVGIYALQGRRATMEDRFSVMHEVDVGGKNKLSFFGVYDGHGGQYVADYVKDHLFTNTIKKIKEIRSGGSLHVTKNGISRKRSSGSESLNTRTNNNIANGNAPKGIKCNDDRRPSSAEEEIIKIIIDPPPSDVGTEKEAEKYEEEKDKTNEVVEEKQQNRVEEIKRDKLCGNEEVIMKKEDPYSNVNLRRKSVTSNAKETCNAAETENKSYDDLGAYVDANSHINYTKLLTDQIMNIDRMIVDHCKSKTDLSGTTAVIAVLDGELLIIGNVGDSRAVMGDLKGSTIPLSFDHKPNQLKEMKRIKEAGGFITFTGVWRVAGILATSRALGDFPLKDPRRLITAEPDVLTFSLKDHKAHFVILATDGLWDVLSNEEAVAYVQKHIHESDFGAKSLVMYAYSRGSMDNITVAILNLRKLSV